MLSLLKLYKLVQMIYRIENIQIVFEDNTRSNVKCENAIIVHDLNIFRKVYKQRLLKRKSPVKYIHFTYEEYCSR